MNEQRMCIPFVSLGLAMMTCAVAHAATGSIESAPITSLPAARPPEAEESAATTSDTPTKPLDLSRRVIRKAAADVKDADEHTAIERTRAFSSGGVNAQQKIDRAFKDAEIPTCLTMDAWKFGPPHIGPIMITGILAAPWLVHVIATGKCRH